MHQSAGTHRTQFHGDGGSLFVIHLRNLLLTIITLGIYSFWAKTEVRKYLYSQTSFAGDRFSYHGTGGELLKGWAKAAGLYLVGTIGAQMIGGAAGIGIGKDLGTVVATLLLGVGIAFGLVPLALLGSRRYRLSRTSWRGIRFSFRGSFGEMFAVYAPGLLLTIITLGLYFPVYEMNMRHYLVKESRFGSEGFAFDGRVGDVYGRFLLAMVLTILTLGIYYCWWAAFKHRYFWSKTSIAGARFESSVTGGDYFVLSLTNFLLLVITLGIAYPWIQARTMRFHTERLTMTGSAAFEGVVQQMGQATATGAELAEMFDVEIVGADLFGL